jgi:Leucine-rich repeat (LRR) protein
MRESLIVSFLLSLISVDYNNLEGSLFTELGQLSNLQYLNLTSDQLSGTIPTELSKLAFLDTLGLCKLFVL